MARCTTLVTATLALLLLLAPPALGWYQPVAGPATTPWAAPRGSCPVSAGGARVPSACRRNRTPERHAEPRECKQAAGGGSRWGRSASQPPLPTQALCVKDVAPNLQSCERLPDGQGTFQCKADVFLSLRASDCQSA